MGANLRFLLAFSLVGVLSLAGCGSSSAPSGSNSGGGDQSAASESAEQAEVESTTVEEPEAEPEPAAPDSDYVVTIDGARLAEDYQGNPAVVVSFTFTNNSDDSQAFMTSTMVDVYQNGVECEMAIGADYDSGSSMSKIRPGATTTVELAYQLKDTSEIEVEVKELSIFDDSILAYETFSFE